METNNKTHILVTGAAGFIGSQQVEVLLKRNYRVTGMDNINSYYDTSLKYARLAVAGIAQETILDGNSVESITHSAYRFIKLDLADRIGVEHLFEEGKFDIVVNLAGQAGVRYSIENPYAYVESNVLGFLNVLEACRHMGVKHLLYASSSSIYGMGDHVPYREDTPTDHPVSLYAATKKSDELMAYAYSKLYGIPVMGLRLFTVYGPWGRPDMAPYLFMKSVLDENPIKVFNHGNLSRDFTYIDDIINGILLLIEHPSEESIPARIYNIGHASPVNLLDFISTIERVTGRKAVMQMEDMQPGDVYCTCADVSHLQHDFGYHPEVSIEEGIKHFYDWFRKYHHLKVCHV